MKSVEKAAYFTVSEGNKLGATATLVSRGSGAALGADSTSEFSRAVSRRTTTQERIPIAGCNLCNADHCTCADIQRSKVTVVTSQI